LGMWPWPMAPVRNLHHYWSADLPGSLGVFKAIEGSWCL